MQAVSALTSCTIWAIRKCFSPTILPCELHGVYTQKGFVRPIGSCLLQCSSFWNPSRVFLSAEYVLATTCGTRKHLLCVKNSEPETCNIVDALFNTV